MTLVHIHNRRDSIYRSKLRDIWDHRAVAWILDFSSIMDQYSWRAGQNNLQICVARHDQWPAKERSSVHERRVIHDGEASTGCTPRGAYQNAQVIDTVISGHSQTRTAYL
jgi:hypothetical protein